MKISEVIRISNVMLKTNCFSLKGLEAFELLTEKLGDGYRNIHLINWAGAMIRHYSGKNVAISVYEDANGVFIDISNGETRWVYKVNCR